LSNILEKINEDDLRSLQKYADEEQNLRIEAIIKCGGVRRAATSLGLLSHTGLVAMIARLRRRARMDADNAALHGSIPSMGLDNPSPDIMMAHGYSILHPRTDNTPMYWAKYKLDPRRMDALVQDFGEAFAADLPRLPPLPAPEKNDEDLCTLYGFWDFHNGMLAWGEESGEDWDLKIAETVMGAAMDEMMARSPDAALGIVMFGGDINHSDNIDQVTPASSHHLDADGRFGKVIKVLCRSLRRCIDRALDKHANVVVQYLEGNHDPVVSKLVSLLLSAVYEHNARVRVVDSESPYHAEEFGVNMLAFHHGHLKKVDQCPMIFATRYPEMWGRTKYRVVHSGHLHHKYIKEYAGMIVHQHQSLSAKDAYAARGGYDAMRGAEAITYHRLWGEYSTVTVRPKHG
jgi:hypothetical protein